MYLQETFFVLSSIKNLQKVFKHIKRGTWNGREQMWTAGHWYGILGTVPGTGSGTLTLEARHAQWEDIVRTGTQKNIFRILPQMQEMYDDHWSDLFGWGEKLSFDHFPKQYDESLLNGGALRSAGRSPAVDFWRNRGEGNHQRVHKQTGAADSDNNGNSTFYVLRTEKHAKETPAEAKISPSLAQNMVDLITNEGNALEATLLQTTIVEGELSDGTWSVNIDRVEDYLCRHCVVMCGHLPKAYWPRYRKGSKISEDFLLCTCKWFIQHACCEHVYFVATLRGQKPHPSMDRAPNLEDTVDIHPHNVARRMEAE